MKASKKLLGMPVLSLESGEKIGTVKDYIIDPQALKIAAILLERNGGWARETRIITFEHIKNAGEHAITVGISKCAVRASAVPEIMSLAKQNTRLIGAKIITGQGNLLGTAEEFYFDPANGQIIALELSGHLLDTLFKGRGYLRAAYIKTLGRHAVIVSEEAAENLERQESAFAGTVKNVRETSSKVWGQTRETTKRWGEALSKSVEKFSSDEDEDTTVQEEPLSKEAPPEGDETPAKNKPD